MASLMSDTLGMQRYPLCIWSMSEEAMSLSLEMTSQAYDRVLTQLVGKL